MMRIEEWRRKVGCNFACTAYVCGGTTKELRGKALEDYFRSMGYSRKDICDLTDISYRTLQNWFTGEREPPLYLLQMIDYILYVQDEILSDSTLIV